MKSSRLIVNWLVLIALLLAAACTPQPAASPTAPAAPAETEAAPEETITLKVWDIFVRPEETAIMDKIIARYQAAHPNVKVVREAKSMDDLKATTALGLGSEDGPDVAMVNQGQSDMGALVAAGLLLPLDDYAKQYGWFDKFPGGLVRLNSWTKDGKQMGEGNFYALPIQSEVVGVYYRKDLFEQNGLSIPKSMDEFVKVADTFVSKDITPIVFGNLDAWPAIHTYSELQNVEMPDRTWYDDFMFTTGKVDFNVPENVQAAANLQDWVNKGYFTKGFEGIGYDDAWQLFSNGDGAMLLTGSWLSGDLGAGPNGKNIGFFLLPPKEAGGFKMSVGGTGFGFAIRATAANPDLAAEYINFLYSEETAKEMIDAGFFPVYPIDTSGLEEGLVKDIANAWTTINQNNAVGYYMDWVTPTMYDTISSSLQELLALRVTPQEFVNKVNADYSSYLEEKGVR